MGAGAASPQNPATLQAPSVVLAGGADRGAGAGLNAGVKAPAGLGELLVGMVLLITFCTAGYWLYYNCGWQEEKEAEGARAGKITKAVRLHTPHIRHVRHVRHIRRIRHTRHTRDSCAGEEVGHAAGGGVDESWDES